MEGFSMTLAQIKARLREGQFVWPGGYPLYFLTADGAALSFKTVRQEWCSVVWAHLHGDRRCGWFIDACDINWEDGDLTDDHTGERIESAYGH
jgi:hypothetical protein